MNHDVFAIVLLVISVLIALMGVVRYRISPTVSLWMIGLGTALSLFQIILLLM